MNTYKIVLTGGPCGGKTCSLHFLDERLASLGYSVKVVEETAESLLALEYMPGVNISPFDFQNLLFKIQFTKEYISEGKTQVLLCDRGLFDGKVYIDDGDFQKILALNGVDAKTLFRTYDGALYFKSISYKYPEEFSQKRIYETPEVGRMRDACSYAIWKDKIISCDYDDLDGFTKKQETIYQTLKGQLELLKQITPNSLASFYDRNHFNYIYNGIDEILVSNEVPHGIKIKTRGLIK